ISTGASNDIERATKMAKAMVTQYGFSEKLGAMVYGSKDDGEVFLGMELGHDRGYSEEIAVTIDREVRSLIDAGYARATKILTDNMAMLMSLSEYLKKYEKIDGDDFEQLMSGKITPEELTAKAEQTEADAAAAAKALEAAEAAEAAKAEKAAKEQGNSEVTVAEVVAAEAAITEPVKAEEATEAEATEATKAKASQVAPEVTVTEVVAAEAAEKAKPAKAEAPMKPAKSASKASAELSDAVKAQIEAEVDAEAKPKPKPRTRKPKPKDGETKPEDKPKQ
ncbi:MAG: hypothetical protein RR049_02775, partial [Angelakisella sp.]